jgi:hypothetical protein
LEVIFPDGSNILLHKTLILQRQNSYADSTNFSLDEVLQTAWTLPQRGGRTWLFYLCKQKLLKTVAAEVQFRQQHIKQPRNYKTIPWT